MRGGATAIEGAISRPANVISSTSGGASMQVRFIACASGSLTRLTTNSPDSSMLCALSLCVPSGRRIMPITTIGGAAPIMLKKLNGAALRIPLADWLVTHAIGRGVIAEAIRR